MELSIIIDEDLLHVFIVQENHEWFLKYTWPKTLSIKFTYTFSINTLNNLSRRNYKMPLEILTLELVGPGSVWYKPKLRTLEKYESDKKRERKKIRKGEGETKTEFLRMAQSLIMGRGLRYFTIS